MKYKKKLEHLKQAQKWWDSQSRQYQASTTRPGSINQRIIVGTK